MIRPVGNAARPLVFAFAIILLCVAPVRAQTAPSAVLAQAATLRDAGEFAGAARLLEHALQRSPRDAALRRMLAQVLYWLHRIDDAVANYDAALAAAPADAALRLEYGRTLIELRREGAAREVLQPLLASEDTAAHFLLGLDAYWRGDFSAAAARFQRVVASSPQHAEANRLLHEIRSASAPWLRVEPHGQHDSQQLNRAGLNAEAGFFLTPLHALGLEASTRRFTWADSSTTVSVAHLTTRRFFPRTGLTAAVAVGAAHWSGADSLSLVGRASLALRLASRVEIAAAAERLPYVATTASLAAPLTLDRGELRLTLERGRFLAEAAGHVDRFPDDNRVYTAYAWALMPVVRGAEGDLKVGYAIAAQGADEIRVVPVRTGTTSAGAAEYALRYAPYHTPRRVIAHSVAAAGRARLSAATDLTINASWAFHAREDAFLFLADATDAAPLLVSYRRAFHPLELRSTLNATLTPRSALFFEASHTRTAFYEATQARAGLVLRFVPEQP